MKIKAHEEQIGEEYRRMWFRKHGQPASAVTKPDERESMLATIRKAREDYEEETMSWGWPMDDPDDAVTKSEDYFIIDALLADGWTRKTERD